MMKFLTALSFALSLCSYANSETLKALIYEKYSQRLSDTPIIRTRVNAMGEVVTYSVPPPPYNEKQLLRNADIVNLLEDFENNPAGVFDHPKLKHYVLARAVKDYDTDQFSRRIINHCLEYCVETNYMRSILAVAVRYNAISLIDRLIDMEISLIDDEDDVFDFFETSFSMAVVHSGNYHIAKDLILRGYPVDTADVWMEKICVASVYDNIDVVLDFLDFLINTMGMFDLNRQLIRGQPALHLLLSARSNKPQDFQYRTEIAHHLTRLGADPFIVDAYGKTAIQYATLRGIDLGFGEA